MKTLRIAALIALMVAPIGLTTPVRAQGIGTNLIPEMPSKTPDEIERDKALERDYKEGLKKIPDAKASSDPWGNVRSADTPAKPAAAKAKVAPAKTAKTATANKMAPQ